MTARILLFPRDPNQTVHNLTQWAAQRNGRIRAVPVNGGKGPIALRLRPTENRTTVAVPFPSTNEKV